MSTRLLVGTRKGLFTYGRGDNGNWTVSRTAFIADPVTMVLQDARDGWMYAALNHGHFGVKLHRSSDAGENWEECAVPIYPPAEETSENVGEAATNQGDSLKLIWSLETGGLDEPQVLWAGTLPGGLFRSTDRGSTWELNAALWNRPERKKWFGGGYDHPGIHSICVDPRDSNRILVGVSCGGVCETTDGGKNWEGCTSGMFAEYMPPDQREDPDTQDPHRLVQCPAQPDSLWVQHHNGIFHSGDHAGTWEHVPNDKPSSFGFAVAVHPQDGGTAWFVPAVKDECRVPVDGRLVVTRTRDRGERFDVLSKGLPQEHAYDLVYRHGLDIDNTGDRLAFGSTTGGLWVSEDQGDSWHTVSTHLPPVYCVRFVG